METALGTINALYIFISHLLLGTHNCLDFNNSFSIDWFVMERKRFIYVLNDDPIPDVYISHAFVCLHLTWQKLYMWFCPHCNLVVTASFGGDLAPLLSSWWWSSTTQLTTTMKTKVVFLGGTLGMFHLGVSCQSESFQDLPTNLLKCLKRLHMWYINTC